MIFRDRFDAGKKLAKNLEKCQEPPTEVGGVSGS